MNYQELLSKSFPFLARLYRKLRLYRLSLKNTQQVFTDIYKKNTWQSSESVSGFGSTMESTTSIRSALPVFISDFKIKTFLDLPCGDFNWMKTVNLSGTTYIGADIVADLIRENNKRYGNDRISFIRLNLLEDPLPDADVLFCRDCLVHLSFNDIGKAIANIKQSRINYFLTTTFPNIEKNENIVTGRWRRLNLQEYPFNFPSPLSIIEENGRQGADRKCLGVWRVNDINSLH